jgi:Flp pilus assembly protein TadD
MTKSTRYGFAISLVTLATMIAGCAAPQNRVVSSSGFGGPSGDDVGVATRALAALNAHDIPAAVSLSERAVEKTPDDAGFRALLGNAYFAAGRFASAEAAYKDALSIYSNQPQVVLKLALVQIAQGKNAEAVSYLDAARDVIGPADYGLALALAGRPADAIAVLEPAARAQNADARVRQNLALAHAFAGDWTTARTVAAQDVPAGQLDARIQKWMQLANPARPSDQVAALIGVTPAASDPGQPVRLALRKSDTRLAQAAPVAVPAPAPAFSQPQVVPAVAADPAPEAVPAVASAPETAPAPAPVAIAQAAAAAPEAPALFAALAPKLQPVRKPAKVQRAAAKKQPLPVRNAALRKGNANSVVQLGAYGSPERVAAAWNKVARRFSDLRGYTPVSARFDSPKGTFYRLSVKGFVSDREARLVCESLRRSGGSCFVRNVAGDAPVQIASR